MTIHKHAQLRLTDLPPILDNIEMLNPSMMDGTRPPLQITNELDDLELGEDGSFSVVLERGTPRGLRR